MSEAVAPAKQLTPREKYLDLGRRAGYHDPCGCITECATHRAALEMLAALEDLNARGAGSAFGSGSPRLVDLLARARGARP